MRIMIQNLVLEAKHSREPVDGAVYGAVQNEKKNPNWTLQHSMKTKMGAHSFFPIPIDFSGFFNRE